MNIQPIRDFIKSERQRQGKTKRSIDTAGHGSTLSRIENGTEGDFTIYTLDHIANALGYNVQISFVEKPIEVSTVFTTTI